MKVITIIFTLYILGLAMLPCSDNVNGEEHNHTEYSVEDDHDHSGHCDDDLCAPFCMCACCQTVTTVAHFLFTSDFISPSWNDDYKDGYQDSVSSLFLRPLFQPPRG